MRNAARFGVMALTIAGVGVWGLVGGPAVQTYGPRFPGSGRPRSELIPAGVVNLMNGSSNPKPIIPVPVGPGHQNVPFNVCPGNCGAFQVGGAIQFPDGEKRVSLILDVPLGMRFTIRHVAVSVRASSANSLGGASRSCTRCDPHTRELPGYQGQRAEPLTGSQSGG